MLLTVLGIQRQKADLSVGKDYCLGLFCYDSEQGICQVYCGQDA